MANLGFWDTLILSFCLDVKSEYVCLSLWVVFFINGNYWLEDQLRVSQKISIQGVQQKNNILWQQSISTENS